MFFTFSYRRCVTSFPLSFSLGWYYYPEINYPVYLGGAISVPSLKCGCFNTVSFGHILLWGLFGPLSVKNIISYIIRWRQANLCVLYQCEMLFRFSGTRDIVLCHMMHEFGLIPPLKLNLLYFFFSSFFQFAGFIWNVIVFSQQLPSTNLIKLLPVNVHQRSIKEQ